MRTSAGFGSTVLRLRVSSAKGRILSPQRNPPAERLSTPEDAEQLLGQIQEEFGAERPESRGFEEIMTLALFEQHCVYIHCDSLDHATDYWILRVMLDQTNDAAGAENSLHL